MKINRCIAAFGTAAAMTFSSADIVSISSYAYEENWDYYIQTADWIPTDYEEALNFRNQYGTVHIGETVTPNDTVCFVFPESCDEKLEYDIKKSCKGLKEVCRSVYTSDEEQVKYEVVAYTNVNQLTPEFSFDVTFYCNSEPQNTYSFKSVPGSIAEYDIYSWLPDSMTEYNEFVENNGEVSVRDNYVVFCLDSDKEYEWLIAPDADESPNLEYFCESACGTEKKVAVYKAVTDGHTKITCICPDENGKELTADCAVIDNMQTILLSDMVRISVIDADTEELITDHVPVITPQIRVSKDGDYSDENIGFNANPFIWKDTLHLTSDYFELELTEKNIPYGYMLPDDYMNVIKSGNNALDIVFRLKKDENALAAGKLKITLKDKDTGELIPDDILANHPFSFGTEIIVPSEYHPDSNNYYNPYFTLKSNQCVYSSDLALTYKKAKKFLFACDDQPEVILHNNDSMELIFTTKLTVSGDVNGDEHFNISDVVLLQKWLMGKKGAELTDWTAADFCIDNQLDVFDLCLMKRELIVPANKAAELSIDEVGGFMGKNNSWKVYCEEGMYYISFKANRGGDELITTEISEQEYNSIMSINFKKYINARQPGPFDYVNDALYYCSVITFADGTEKTTSTPVPEILNQIKSIFNDHVNDVSMF